MLTLSLSLSLSGHVTSYTKMGFAGNMEPQFVIPTALTTKAVAGTAAGARASEALSSSAARIEDLDFETGYAAVDAGKSATVSYPIRHGQVENWDWMEAYWQHCIFKYLRCDPEEHFFMLTEPPLNAPENREYTAEIMFETFNVPGLYIAVQAVLALAASWISGKRAADSTANVLTGTVIDSGDGVTHVIPVVEGYAIGSAIKHVPIAGRDVTYFIQQLLRDRNEANLPPELTMDVARRIKEEYTYVAPNLAREFAAYDRDASLFRTMQHTDTVTNRVYNVEVGYERFLAAEVFFNPELVSSEHLTPLPALVDTVIQACPVDSRRGLYSNIVLSGGSTLFKDFSKRLQRDLGTIVDRRLAYVKSIQSASIVNKSATPSLTVQVLSHANQRHAVYSGGSLFASMDQFPAYCHTKAEYDEVGPNICRQSRVFTSLL